MADEILDAEPAFALRAKPITEQMLLRLREAGIFGQYEVGEGGCWNWTGTLNNKGYGRFQFEGKSYGAHRVAFAVGKNTALPGIVVVCHRCDNPRCMNPEHLFLGTLDDNNQDMRAKGRARAPKGEASPKCKLTEKDIADIRASALRQADLCRLYGISDGHMSRIISGKKRPGSAGRMAP